MSAAKISASCVYTGGAHSEILFLNIRSWHNIQISSLRIHRTVEAITRGRLHQRSSRSECYEDGFLSSMLKQNKLEFVTKEQNRHMCLCSERLRLLNMFSYLAAGTSYSVSFWKSSAVKNPRAFPLRIGDDLSKLNSDTLPPHEAFYSTLESPHEAFHNTLKQTNITPEEYACCQQVSEREAMSTMKDFFKWYNSGDTKPFFEAIQKISTYVFTTTLRNHFKGWISSPGLAVDDFFTDIRTFFTLP